MPMTSTKPILLNILTSRIAECVISDIVCHAAHLVCFRMTENPHFQAVPSFDAARELLTFRPVEPEYTAGHRLQSVRIHMRDHKLRDVPIHDRTLEAHYGAFSFSQSRKGTTEARRNAIDIRYGQVWRDAQIAGREACVYELGPEPPPDDIDGRSPAVVTWHDGEMFYLIASTEMSAEELVSIARKIYK